MRTEATKRIDSIYPTAIAGLRNGAQIAVVTFAFAPAQMLKCASRIPNSGGPWRPGSLTCS